MLELEGVDMGPGNVGWNRAKPVRIGEPTFRRPEQNWPRWLTDCGGEALKVGDAFLPSFCAPPFMSWEFTEDAAFLALCDAYKESGEPSAMEFLAHGEGAFHFQELTQNAAGEGIDLSDSADLEEFQQEVIDALEEMCS
jgi:hypothetical protein